MPVQANAPDMNQWGTVTFQLPDKLADVRDKINTTAEFLVSVLDIALTALELVKTFLIGYLDPIGALVAAIIAEVEALVTDMRQLGLYITGDWKLMKWPFKELKGGFQEYQRRMISRLTDTTDPTRPDVSADTKVLAMFFYMSEDVSNVVRLVKFIRKIMAYFRQSVTPEGSLPVPVPGVVQYGADAVSILNPTSIPEAFSKSPTPPSLARIPWTMASTSAQSPFNPIPPLPPGGFIVSVSTVQEGLKVVFDAPQSNTSLQESTTDATKTVQAREYGAVRMNESGAPLILFGGVDMIPEEALTDKDLTYNGSMTKGAVENGRSRVYAQLAVGSDGIIPLEELGDLKVDGKSKNILQKVFYVPQTAKWASWATGEYGFVLAAEDMPYTCIWEKDDKGDIYPKNAQLATTAYVRIASLSSEAYNKQLKYQFGPPNGRGGRPYIDATLGLHSVDELGAWSRPVRVTFPGGNTQAYLDALKVALLVLVLSRPDLKLYDPSLQPLEVQKNVLSGKDVRPGEVKIACGLEKMAQLADMVMDHYQTSIKVTGKSPLDFRKQLADSIERVAHNIYNTTGQNTQIEKIVADQTKYLRTVTWGDVLAANGLDISKKAPEAFKTKLLDSLNSEDLTLGLAMNPYSIGIESQIVDGWFNVNGAIQGRKPHMFEVIEGGNSKGMAGEKTIAADKVKEFMASLNPAMQNFYLPFALGDGSIVVPDDHYAMLTAMVSQVHIKGSADESPVFYFYKDGLQTLKSPLQNYNPKEMGTLFYCRGLFANTNGGQIFQESATALSLAAAAIRRSSQDSAWIALRAFDIFPAMDDFFETLVNWMKALQNSMKSIVDTIKRYIEFIEGRLVELQALIRRINDLLQTILGFTFQIPQCSFLMTVSNGTMGVVGDLTNAKTKPGDSPLAYGAGIAVVIPFGPAIAMDLIQALILAIKGDPDPNAMLSVPSAASVVGIEGLPPSAPPGDTPPDVL